MQSGNETQNGIPIRQLERLRLNSRELCESCVILVEGLLIRERRLSDGCRQIVAFYVPGDVCGLTALSTSDGDHSLVALSPVSCVRVSDNWLALSARASVDVSLAIWREIAREAKIATAWIVNLGQRPAYQRLAYFICEFEARLRAAGQDTSAGLDWPGTQADIGAATGMSLVHVNKTLRRLEADGLLSTGRRTQFTNIDKLRVIADFDPSYLAREHEPLGGMLLSRIETIDDTWSRKERGPFLYEKSNDRALKVVS